MAAWVVWAERVEWVAFAVSAGESMAAPVVLAVATEVAAVTVRVAGVEGDAGAMSGSVVADVAAAAWAAKMGAGTVVVDSSAKEEAPAVVAVPQAEGVELLGAAVMAVATRGRPDSCSSLTGCRAHRGEEARGQCVGYAPGSAVGEDSALDGSRSTPAKRSLTSECTVPLPTRSSATPEGTWCGGDRRKRSQSGRGGTRRAHPGSIGHCHA